MVDVLYLDLMRDILENGKRKNDRTGTGTVSVFGRGFRMNMKEGFPLLTTKKVYWNGVVSELLWFLRGDSNIKYLNDHNVHIWDDWQDWNGKNDGEMGRIYSKQWREFRGWKEVENGEIEVFSIDQISDLVQQLKTNPYSRRHLVVAYNPAEVKDCALPACHSFFQVDITDGKLSLLFYMRSNDVFLGLPFNIASYALLTHMLAQVTGYEVGDLVYSCGDCHLYSNHMDQVQEQLSRIPKALPKLELNSNIKDIFDFKHEDINLIGYDPHPAIKAVVAV